MRGATEGELRVRLTRRWGLVGWAGIGDESVDIPGFRLKNGKPTFGVGVRSTIDPARSVSVRADYGYGQDARGIYFNVKEDF